MPPAGPAAATPPHGGHQETAKERQNNVLSMSSVLDIVGYILWYISSYLLTHCIPVAWATMGGAKSPIMTKNAMHVPIFSPITLCVCACVCVCVCVCVENEFEVQ